jgi:hypothetical protein
MVAVLVKVVPPEKNWSAVKLPVAAPPTLMEMVLPLTGVRVGVFVRVGVGPMGVFVRVGVGPTGVFVRVAVGLLPPLATLIPLTFGFSVPVTNWITTWPLLLAVVLNVRAMARF